MKLVTDHSYDWTSHKDKATTIVDELKAKGYKTKTMRESGGFKVYVDQRFQLTKNLNEANEYISGYAARVKFIKEQYEAELAKNDKWYAEQQAIATKSAAELATLPPLKPQD